VFSLAAVPFHAAGAAAEELEEPAVKLGRLEDSQRMSDAGYCSREEVEMLWKQKSRMDVLFDGGHREAYWMARDEIYPEAGHRGSDRQPLGNRSGDKIEEIVSAVGKLKVLNRCKAKGRLVFADVCGAPGAWSKYFFKLGAEAECVVRGFGFSLREGTNALSCTWFPEARSPSKKAANTRLAELAQSLCASKKDPWALVLDAASLTSSTALHGVGFRANRIIVPNDSDAPFGSNCLSKATVLQGLCLQDFIMQNSKTDRAYGPFSCVYCDFTECLYGSWKPPQELEELDNTFAAAPQRSSPGQDLKALFRSGQLESGAVLAVTLAHLRSSKKPEQWPLLRIGALAAELGWCSVVVDRLEQRAVATEFWVLGEPRDTALQELLKAELSGPEMSRGALPQAAPLPAEALLKLCCENFVELWGADGTGNVCLPSNVAHAAAEVGRQADLVMADGGFLVNKGSNGEHMENYQEIVSGSILLAEACLPILHCRRPLLSSSCSILRRAHDSELWKGSIESLDMFVWSICFQASSRL
ncbi:unnamed protein product, partial [Symbiodinium sp. KB8]